AVFEAQHSVIGRRFAVKFLHPELARNESMAARFRREAQAAGSLESDNIAAVVDFGLTDEGLPFIVMEFLEGEDLRHMMSRTGQLPVPRAVQIAIQACRGLALAHAKGIVHRDLKPENLYLSKRSDGSEVVKVLDFGIAKLRGGSVGGASTQAGTMM